MDRSKEAVSIPCHNFSDIRRRPLVIGKLDQVRLPFVVTMPQLAVGAVVFAVLFLTRAAWGAMMSDRLHIIVFVAVPIMVAQQISRTTVEGRPLSKAVAGLFRLWLAPRYGTVNGRKRQKAEPLTITLNPLCLNTPEPPSVDVDRPGLRPRGSGNRRATSRGRNNRRPRNEKSGRRLRR